MKKIKRNAGLKCAAIIVFAVSLVAFALSGVLGLMLYTEDIFSTDGATQLKNNMLENASFQYVSEALNYYQSFINGDDTGEYEERFSSANSNFSFTITPDNKKSEVKYDKLTNYGCSDYQFKNKEEHKVWINSSIDETFEYPVSKKEIVAGARAELRGEVDDFYIFYDSNYYEEDYFEGEATSYNPDTTERYEAVDMFDEYGNYVYTTEVSVDEEGYPIYENGQTSDRQGTEDKEAAGETENGRNNQAEEEDLGDDFNGTYNRNGDMNHYILHDRKVYKLEDDKEFVKAYNKFIDGLPKNADYTYRVYYDTTTETYGINAIGEQYLDVTLEYKIRSNVDRARDIYCSMWYLDYIDDTIEAVFPVILISLVLLIITGAYLIASSGYRKNEEEATLNAYDKIPYDVLVVIFLAMGCFLALFFDEYINAGYWWNIDVYILTGIIGAVMLSIIFATVIMTTATRLRVDGWGFLKNTVTWMIIKQVKRLVVYILSGIAKGITRFAGGITYLWNNIRLIWKFIIVIGSMILIDLFCVLAGEAEVLILFESLELIILTLSIAYGIINYNKIKKSIKELASGNSDYKTDKEHLQESFKEDADNLNRIGEGIIHAVDERMKSERMKTELITNVSHDIKTPLTSIINYVDLLNKEQLDNEQAKEYIDVLERQSARLKKLIQDLIDASKASTGNVKINLERTDVRVLLEQSMGEFAQQLENKRLKVNVTYNTDSTICLADGRQLWRIFENLINNICKYSQEGSRVYIDVMSKDAMAATHVTDNKRALTKESIQIVFKNISAEELNITGEELMERFVRGDSSRNTEGSGLGLSIAKSLIELMNGSLNIVVDGDLFKVILTLPFIPE